MWNAAKYVAHVELGFTSCSSDNLTKAAGPFRSLLAAFRDDERGGISIFVLVLFIMLMLVGGMAVDYQRHEALRADLQDALDRGALAAANLNQNYISGGEKTTDQQVEDLIREYMASRNHRVHGVNVDAKFRQIGAGRQVVAAARVTMPTIFLSLVGVDTLSVNASSIATHSPSKMEVTVVLDVTGSMRSNSQSGRRKIEDLQIAAKEFVATVLADQSVPTLVSIVPFSENVNMPRWVTDLYSIDREHDYGNCIDVDSLDFSTTALPTTPATPYVQMQHFHTASAVFGCPRAANEATVFSNDVTELNDAIDALTTENWTAMFMGMKWGAALIDPSARAIVTEKINRGELDEKFAGWPHTWDDPSVNKIVVLMSDGRNTRLQSVNDALYERFPLDWWNANFDQGLLTVQVNDREGDLMLEEICTAVKGASNVLVYTIGFEITGSQQAQDALFGCASSLSTYYLVEGVEISTAFQNIADEITNLKLTN